MHLGHSRRADPMAGAAPGTPGDGDSSDGRPVIGRRSEVTPQGSREPTVPACGRRWMGPPGTQHVCPPDVSCRAGRGGSCPWPLALRSGQRTRSELSALGTQERTEGKPSTRDPASGLQAGLRPGEGGLFRHGHLSPGSSLAAQVFPTEIQLMGRQTRPRNADVLGEPTLPCGRGPKLPRGPWLAPPCGSQGSLIRVTHVAGL